MSILVITEHYHGAWNKMSFEALAAGVEIGGALGRPVATTVIGSGIGSLQAELASYKVERVLAVEHPLLPDYTPDGFSIALQQVIRKVNPFLVVLPHTY